MHAHKNKKSCPTNIDMFARVASAAWRRAPSAAPLAVGRLARGLAARVGNAALQLPELRLVCERGTQLGVMAPTAALAVASERGLQLFEVAASASPPVWRLRSPPAAPSSERPPAAPSARAGSAPPSPPPRGKAAKPAKPLKVKEVRVTDRCDARDVETKVGNALRFLSKGHVVRLIALNTGRVDDEATAERGSTVSRAEAIVRRMGEMCAEAATSSGVTGRTSVDGASEGRGRSLGIVTLTLRPLQDQSKGAPN